MQGMKPIKQRRLTLADTAYSRISEVLLGGGVAPGSRLVMDELAAQLDISRTPVRDALLRLEREGLIEAANRRGYVVREVARADSAQLYQAREAVECCAAAAAAGLGKKAYDHISAVIEGTADTDLTNVRANYEANLRIHRAFVEVLGNPMMLDLFDRVWRGAKGMSMFAHYAANENRRLPIPQRHRPLVQALRDGPDAAFEAMQKHIRAGLRVTREH
ncbi:MAG: GntR family transcriptional regulator [Nevskiaceae bacterium]|nr:MAG: GntR family transcriptional regulator [Nevskiaceae bacterium]TBR73721.1 MAG: GntR family transcriptional regulator [Nevskiaceae bacterium]